MTLSPDPGNDPLYWGVPLPHVRDLPVLGVPVRFASNSEAILAIADGRFGRWASIPPDLIAPQGVELRLVLHDGEEARGEPITYRMPDRSRFLLHTPGSFGLVDVGRRDGIAYVSQALVADSERFAYGFLEAMTLLLVARQDRQPLHAAMIARGSAALLLAGPTGVGKSTLAYVAHRAGWRVLSDDSVYVQQHPALRVWGVPGRLYVLSEATRHFPGAEHRAERLPSGKEKVAIDLETVWSPGAPVATRVGICLLTRHRGDLSHAAASPGEARAFLASGLGVQVEWYQASLGPALAALCARRAWFLNLSDEPGHALPYLERILAELDGSS